VTGVPSISSLLIGHWDTAWSLDGGAAAAVVAYLGLALRGRGRWPLRRTACFASGIAVVLVALQSGVDAYDERLLSVHMVQHMLLLLPAPLLLLEGRPLILVLRSLDRPHRAMLLTLLARMRRIGNPFACLAAFSVTLILAHVPPVYAATLAHPLLHAAEHGLLLAAGAAFWWPLLDGDPLPARRLGGIARIIYLLGSMPAMALVGAYLNRAPSVVYPGYAAPARALGISAVNDQQQAGAIMWVAGSCFMIAVGLWIAMATMIAEDRRQSARERALGTRPPAGRSAAATREPIA
jgi:putative copper resistance protein D